MGQKIELGRLFDMNVRSLYMPVTIAVLLALQLTGCNTTEGIGKDVKAAGQAIEEGAESVKESISD